MTIKLENMTMKLVRTLCWYCKINRLSIASVYQATRASSLKIMSSIDCFKIVNEVGDKFS